jgi:hypothetical protein
MRVVLPKHYHYRVCTGAQQLDRGPTVTQLVPHASPDPAEKPDPTVARPDTVGPSGHVHSAAGLSTAYSGRLPGRNHATIGLRGTAPFRTAAPTSRIVCELLR